LALACIISVMLGVATLIVVNSVMSGFSTKLRDRLHNLLSDVLLESTSLDGFADPDGKMKRIHRDPYLADKIEAMTPTMEVFAMLQFRVNNGEAITRPVRLIGIEPDGRSAIGGFKEFLQNQKNKEHASFEVPDDALRNYDWHMRQMMPQMPKKILEPGYDPEPEPPPSKIKVPRGAIIGKLIATVRYKDEDNPGKLKEITLLHPGDQVTLITVSGAIPTANGTKMVPVNDAFLVVDYFKSDMSEYDSNCVFVPLEYLQHIRTMDDRATNIQIKLKNHNDSKVVVERLRELFPDKTAFNVTTWEDKQGALLAAIAIEKGILNVLLFMIIGVAGFGILAIFTMIVAEKTRDIGILKALGAPSGGVMQIFLSYGLLLGIVGTLIGSGLGIWLTTYINEVEHAISLVTHQDIFNRDVYYFKEIPTDIQFWSVFLIDIGAVTIAVVFSVLPALRAAMLHPVSALRYE
jgi:lipoprotein-releasing system permease protein